ncbi:hypothetical protein [Hymenobacter sp. GOD-10R]|uniref:hypothetical protein n=1 Tax=Hymenobacter sp. GOD-10R TaxID=3093922 RepID=UPI002D7822CB|nr:hypothetical protein [Hymenobacter sp. GOD-10R]WRQ31974.1 hypothetical protein SD425_29615 [Hymenobacter sp. GOD-10R]
MPPTSLILRVVVEDSASVAEVCLVVQLPAGTTVIWEGDVPYLLGAHWGSERTAAWLGEQFRRHAALVMQQMGHQPLRQALQVSLMRHQQPGGGQVWLTRCLP